MLLFAWMNKRAVYNIPYIIYGNEYNVYIYLINTFSLVLSLWGKKSKNVFMMYVLLLYIINVNNDLSNYILLNSISLVYHVVMCN